MKIILLLLVCFVQYSISSSDGKVVSVRSMYQTTECLEEDNVLYYGFGFNALVSGFSKEEKIFFNLASPNYVQFFCNVPVEAAEPQAVWCFANAEQFPMFSKQVVTLPEDLKSYKDVTIEDWNTYFGNALNMEVSVCARSVSYSFTLGEVFTTKCDDQGQNILTSTGKFTVLSNYLTSSEDAVTYKFKPYIYADGQLSYADCYVVKYPDENSSDEEIKCAVLGNDKAIFFKTSSLVEKESKYMVFDLEEGVSAQVELKECQNGSGATSLFKTGLLLLLSLILL